MKITDASQLQTLQAVRRALLDRKVPSKREVDEMLAPNIDAIIERVQRAKDAADQRARKIEARVVDEIMGGDE